MVTLTNLTDHHQVIPSCTWQIFILKRLLNMPDCLLQESEDSSTEFSRLVMTQYPSIAVIVNIRNNV